MKKKLVIEEPPGSHKLMLSVPETVLKQIDALPEVKFGKCSRQRVILAMVKAWFNDKKAS